MAKSIKKSKVGAPSIWTEEIENKLEEILKVGGTIREACAYARIGERTYYDRTKADKDFSQKMEAARVYTDVMAKRNVGKTVIEGDVDNSKWWLEKKVWKDSPAVLQQFNTNEMTLEFTTDE